MIGPLGYGRYNDDPDHVGCPRAQSDMTPCIARDGTSALADEGDCVGCGADPIRLLIEMRRQVGRSGDRAGLHSPARAAHLLRHLVRDATNPERLQ